MFDPSIPELNGQVSFDCGSWDSLLKISLFTTWELMNFSWCPNPKAGLIWDVIADVVLVLDGVRVYKIFPRSITC